ncbi:MAG: hypothetical protein MUE92_03985 [Chloroflexi bacterium]|nr:hypothetical protein [Chloroflexota bacterium]
MIPITHPEHRHGATLDDTFDFLNTAELDGSGHPVEHLTALADVTGWLEAHGLLHEARRRPIDATPPARAAALTRPGGGRSTRPRRPGRPRFSLTRSPSAQAFARSSRRSWPAARLTRRRSTR